MAFSLFKRSQSKSKLTSVSVRHGFQSTFMTISPPEHDDLLLLKMYIIRQKGIYNIDERAMDEEKQVGIISLFKQEDLFSDRDFECKSCLKI